MTVDEGESEFQALVRDLETDEHGTRDALRAAHERVATLIRAMPVAVIKKHAKLQILKLREASTKTCLEILKSCFENAEIGAIFVDSGGVDALERCFGRLHDSEKPLFYALVDAAARKCDFEALRSLITKIREEFAPEIFGILATCAKSAPAFLFEDDFLERAMAAVPRMAEKSAAIGFLTSLYLNGNAGQRIFLKYFLTKTDFFRQSSAEMLESEVKKAICKPLPGSDDGLKGILAAVDACGAGDALLIVVKDLLAWPSASEEKGERKSDAKEPPAASSAMSKGPPKKKLPKKEKEKADVSKFTQNFTPLRWEKSSTGTVWKSVSTAGMENVFGMDELSSFVKGEVAKSSRAQAFDQPVLETKKNNAINIAFSRIKCTDAELMNLILSRELRDENVIKQLLNHFPTPEELHALRTRDRCVGRAETFFKRCANDAEKIRNALETLNFLSRIDQQSIIESLDVLQNFYKTLLVSTSLVELLRILLFLGNVLNSKTMLGNAEGFALSDIGAFARVRGRNKENVLDMALKKFSLKKELRSDLALLGAASQISPEAIDVEIKELRRSYGRLRDTDGVEAAIAEYSAIIAKHDAVKKLQAEFESFIGARADDDLYKSLGVIYKEL